MNLYEGLYIFPEGAEEEALEDGVKLAREEIEKLGGAVESVTRLGKRAFARELDRQSSGVFVVILFRLDGDKIKALNARYKLTDKIFRTQIVRVRERSGEEQTETADNKEE